MGSFGSWLLIGVLFSCGRGEEVSDAVGMEDDGLHQSLVQRGCSCLVLVARRNRSSDPADFGSHSTHFFSFHATVGPKIYLPIQKQ